MTWYAKSDISIVSIRLQPVRELRQVFPWTSMVKMFVSFRSLDLALHNISGK